MRAITFQAIEARRQRLSESPSEVPSDGVWIKFKYPDGHISLRKFSLSEPIQVMCVQLEKISSVFAVGCKMSLV